jgi:hypothetical protein
VCLIDRTLRSHKSASRQGVGYTGEIKKPPEDGERATV